MDDLRTYVEDRPQNDKPDWKVLATLAICGLVTLAVAVLVLVFVVNGEQKPLPAVFQGMQEGDVVTIEVPHVMMEYGPVPVQVTVKMKLQRSDMMAGIWTEKDTHRKGAITFAIVKKDGKETDQARILLFDFGAEMDQVDASWLGKVVAKDGGYELIDAIDEMHPFKPMPLNGVDPAQPLLPGIDNNSVPAPEEAKPKGVEA